ncbi:MAG: carboxypeptidase regulatory-like domain-containing protein, partial [Acidobacteriota bacterium]
MASMRPALAAAAEAVALSIRGTVLHEAGAGLPGVRVELLPLPTNYASQDALLTQEWPLGEAVAEARSDPSGRFELSAPRAGLWRLRLSAPGRLPLQALTLPVLEPVELAPVRLRPARRAQARLVDARGEAVPGVGVYAVSADPAPDQETGESPWRLLSRLTWSDDDGLFELPRARGELLELHWLTPGSWATDTALLENVSSIRSSSRSASRSASRTFETPGPAAAEGSVTLVIQEADGTPVEGVIVSRVGPLWPLGRSSARGLLHVRGKIPSDASLVAFAPDGRAQKWTDWAAGSTTSGSTVSGATVSGATVSGATVSGATVRAALTLDPAVGVSGRIFDTAGEPIPGALVWPRNEPAAATQTDASGRYELPLPAAGRRDLEVRASGFLAARGTAEVVAGAWANLDLELRAALPQHRNG